MEQFGDYAQYYNAFYQDKDYEKEACDVDKLLKKYGGNVKSIIIFGCGTGSHDDELKKLGYECHGIDISPMMIEEARRKSKERCLGIEYEVADIRKYSSDKKYDAVISLFHVMSYQTSNNDIKSAFRSAKSVLKPGGVFIFDVWYGPGVLTDPPAIRIKEVEDSKSRMIRLCRPTVNEKTNLVDVNYEILITNKADGKTKTIKETHRMRYYFRPEIDEYLIQAGLKLIDNIDCKTLENTSLASWTSYFVAADV